MLLPLTCILLVGLTPLCTGAEQVLTLTLETPGLEARISQRTLPTTSNVTSTSAQVRNAGHSTVGRIGSVISEKANIYAQRNGRSRVLALCTQDTSLAIVGEIDDWYGALMIDGSTGWIAKKHVKLLDYQLIQSKVAAARFGTLTSRSGPVDRSVSAALGHRIVQEAYRYLGVPYVWGGTSNNGLDCSGFVQKVCATVGIRLPRTSREQANVGEPIALDEMQAGDRIFFASKGHTVDHVGIYIGDNLFIHSSAGRRGVGIDDVTKPFWMQSLVTIRR